MASGNPFGYFQLTQGHEESILRGLFLFRNKTGADQNESGPARVREIRGRTLQ
jgi:hypothetical protein